MKSSRRKLDLPRPADTRAFFAKYLTSEKVSISIDTCTYSLAVKNELTSLYYGGRSYASFFIQRITFFHNDVHQ